MKAGDVIECIDVELQVAALLFSLAAHHVNQRLIPSEHLFPLTGVETLVSVHDFFADQVYIESEGAYYIFYLPHVKQIFRDVFPFLR